MVGGKEYAIWFVTGSQHLYGLETLKQVAAHSQAIVQSLDSGGSIPFRVVFKPVLTTPEAISALCLDANSDPRCGGVIAWMHTFSPARMWIAGLASLQKPMLHLHTQFNRDIPWSTIDMDFMNLNQSAHGDREFGFMMTRMRKPRKIVAGHWEAADVRQSIGTWARTAVANVRGKSLKVARFGDNMREVAVTEGDKVEAQMRLGWSINGFGVGDLVERITSVDDAEVDRLMREYEEIYDFGPGLKTPGPRRGAVREQARMELGMRAFLTAGGFEAFTTTFEDLHGLPQLPGLAVQRLMAEGYGFGGEGDWKTAALVRTMKMMAEGQGGGTSFMEDYTYHFEPGGELVLGAHMLEICPSIASTKPRVEVHPLGIGGKADPARLVFDCPAGAAVNASLVDMGDRFRLIVNDVDAVKADFPMPNLPVARVLWKPRPSLRVSAEAWILAGGAHHTGFSYAVTAEQLFDWSEMAGVECVLIDKNTEPLAFRQAMRLRV